MLKLKRNRWIMLFILSMILTSSISVYATTTYLASQITYKDEKNVEQALNELYNKKPSGTENITANGNYDIASKANVNVNVDRSPILVASATTESSNRSSSVSTTFTVVESETYYIVGVYAFTGGDVLNMYYANIADNTITFSSNITVLDVDTTNKYIKVIANSSGTATMTMNTGTNNSNNSTHRARLFALIYK